MSPPRWPNRVCLPLPAVRVGIVPTTPRTLMAHVRRRRRSQDPTVIAMSGRSVGSGGVRRISDLPGPILPGFFANLMFVCLICCASASNGSASVPEGTPAPCPRTRSEPVKSDPVDATTLPDLGSCLCLERRLETGVPLVLPHS
ncbi:hypothetical protein LX36DRAFT_483428 [Colletotrichum falcatum]|nr:hypothetical protein LX36DRAFT_483428 [Colletotrichum falcatum]